jgi:hypothetical protein
VSAQPNKRFLTLEEAQAYMEEKGVTKFDKVMKSGAGETTPLGGQGFYGAANGANPAIYSFYWYGLLKRILLHS